MALAEVFEAVAGPDAPVEFRAYDGSQAGAAGSAVKITSARRRPRPTWPRRREDSGWPGRLLAAPLDISGAGEVDQTALRS